jgi:probable rRNA maturation factor
MNLNVFKQTSARLPRARLQRLFELVTGGEDVSQWPSTINLIVVDDDRIRELNRQYRGKDNRTDVLAFNLDEPDDPDGIFGEVYVSAETAAEQAGEYGCSFSLELLRLAAHGWLHLIGYRDDTDDSREVMIERQEDYLRKLQEVREQS